jgi:hypothetical protein
LQVESVISPETVQAYRETDFRVEIDPSLVLRIDVRNPALAELCKAFGAETCVFITACNPNGVLLSDGENLKLQEQLLRELGVRSLNYLPGEGKHPTGEWPGEPSFLVFGLSLEAAKTLGRRFHQNAVVWCGSDAIPQLLILQ